MFCSTQKVVPRLLTLANGAATRRRTAATRLHHFSLLSSPTTSFLNSNTINFHNIIQRCISSRPPRQVQESVQSDNVIPEKSLSNSNDKNLVRLSKLVSQHAMNMTMSRREAERLIRAGSVTISGKVVTDPTLLLSFQDASHQIKVDGQRVVLQGDESSGGSSDGSIQQNPTKVWLVHKLNGEVVAENDPYKRQSMIDRLVRGGVGHRKGRSNWHLKPIGRLDMSTEGLILVTNDGKYAREMELPSNKVHRTYRVRVHGILTPRKLKAIRVGSVVKNNTRYPPMKVELERVHKGKQSSTNIWMRITCTQGKNRQIRNVMEQLGLKVTRLIRVSVGDYQLQTIPPGMAIEVPVKAIADQKRKGSLFSRNSKNKFQRRVREENVEPVAPPVEWVRNI